MLFRICRTNYLEFEENRFVLVYLSFVNHLLQQGEYEYSTRSGSVA